MSEPLEEVAVKPSRRLSSLWLIPLLAAVIGAWLVYKHLTEQGPLITITFMTASGLEAGRTQVKYKDVQVGAVKRVTLSDDLAHIEVSARMDRAIAAYLNQNTRFWVVRPRIDTSGVSGLNTLISGAYIAMDPGSGVARSLYQGLETPPITPAETPGLHLTLTAERAGWLSIGSPIYYKQLPVGRIETRELDLEAGRFAFGIFIDAPYDRLIDSNTRFWNASGIDISVGADGFQARAESLETLVLGGISFENVPSALPVHEVQDGSQFALYPDQASIHASVPTFTQLFVLHFDDSVRGLKAGAPVEFRGVQLGQVKDVSLVYDEQRGEVRLPVLIELELDYLTQNESDTQSAMNALQDLVTSGLRAQLQIGSLLTGQLFIGLDMYPDAPGAHIVLKDPYPELPTVASPLNQIAASATQILGKLEKLPLEALLQAATALINDVDSWLQATDTQQLPSNLNQALADVQRLTRNLDDQVAKTAKNVRATLASGDKTLSGLATDAPLYYELTRALRELTQAARQIRTLAEQLEKSPQSLLFGK